MTSPRDVDELRARIRAGWSPQYVLFFDPEPARRDLVGHGCLSQWYAAPMEIDGERFPTAEHYMMWYKARLFGDEEIARELFTDDDPAVAKQLGRRVRNFNTEIWTQHRYELIVRASIAKFTQHEHLREYLLGTGDKVLAEASAVDLIWGIGFDAEDERARDALAWRGMSLLGFALMEARDGEALNRRAAQNQKS